ncbi:MAG TPA: hypothetical protein VMX74_05820 [Pirellulales bacterium]|nr:hypothetical protein [Pirellulales bacterium]
MDKSLTPRQAEILDAIRRWFSRKRYAPTLRELCSFVGGLTINAMAGHLDRLREKGYVTWEPGLARTLRLTAAGRREYKEKTDE